MTQNTPALPPPKLILASGSPRRQQLLADAGYQFILDPADIDETVPGDMLPSQAALHLSQAKANVVSRRHLEDVTLAADTIVAFGDQKLGKPADPADARNMLTLLAGTTHLVITGVCVLRPIAKIVICRRSMSAVRMRRLTPQEIDRYIESNEWRGKAGGYGIQDHDPFVTRVAGSYTNIVGLPMTMTRSMLAEAGIEPPPPRNT